MGGAMTAADLLAELGRRGIQVEAHGDRLRYRPRSAVTPELAQRLKSHKRELLAILGDAGGVGGRNPAGLGVGSAQAVCSRCGSGSYVDVPIHGGRSLRRDCRRCGRFIAFVVWYGRLLHPGPN